MDTMDFRTTKQKLYDLKEGAKMKVQQGLRFIKENPTAVPIICTAIGGITRITSKVISSRTAAKEIDFRQRTIYDRSLGRYIELKRPLTTRQAIEIEERRASGEKLHMILDSMNLLKR